MTGKLEYVQICKKKKKRNNINPTMYYWVGQGSRQLSSLASVISFQNIIPRKYFDNYITPDSSGYTVDIKTCGYGQILH